jgi:hypothetical protein
MRLGRSTSTTGSDGEGAVPRATEEERATLRQACEKLEYELKARDDSIARARHALSTAQKDHSKRVDHARKATEQSGRSRRLASFGGVQLFEDRIVARGRAHWLTAEVSATVDSAGNLSRTRRHTLTRFALIGPLSFFTPKKTKHDDRQLFLLLEGPDWAELLECDKKAQAQTRALAQSINLAARNVEPTRQARDQHMAAAQAALESTLNDTANIAACDDALRRAEVENAGVVTAAAELRAALERYPEAESRQGRGAVKLLERVESSLSTRSVLPELPAGMESIEPSPPALPPATENPPDATSPTTTHEPTVATDGASDADLAEDPIETIRRLGGLRDSGLISAEEFEAKKAELLRRV